MLLNQYFKLNDFDVGRVEFAFANCSVGWVYSNKNGMEIS